MKRALKKIGYIGLWVTGLVVLTLVLLIFLVRLPSVQNYITHKAVSYISSKTHTRVSIQRLYVGFPKSLIVEGFFAEDKTHDTLVYIGSLEADPDLWKLRQKILSINDISLENTTAHIEHFTDSSFNFSFIADALIPNNKAGGKDTSTGSWQVQLKSLHLHHVNTSYRDHISGDILHASVGQMALDLHAFDAGNLRFEGNELLLADASVQFTITKPGEDIPEDTIASLLPVLQFDKYKLERVAFQFSDKPAGTFVDVRATLAEGTDQLVDLDKQLISGGNVNLGGTSTFVTIRDDTAETDEEIPGKITNNGWIVKTAALTMKESTLGFDVSDEPRITHGMDYSHLHFSNITLETKDGFYSDDVIKANIRNLALHERCGLEVKSLKTMGVFDDRHIELAGLDLRTARSHIAHHAAISYPSLNQLIQHPDVLHMEADLRNARIELAEILYFAPWLRNERPFSLTGGYSLRTDGHVSGTVKDLQAKNLVIRNSNASAVSLDAHVVGLPDAAHSRFDLNIRNLVTTRVDIANFLRINNYPIDIPSTVLLKGTFNGTPADFKTRLALRTSSGDLTVQGTAKKVLNDTTFELRVEAMALDAGYILKKPGTLGKTTGIFLVKGKNLSPKRMESNVDANIASIVIRNYAYEHVKATALAWHEKYEATLKVNDSNLVMDMEASVSTVDKQEYFIAEVDLEGVDLERTRFTKENIRSSGKLNVDLTGKDLESLTGRISLNRIRIIKNEKTYRIDSFLVATVNDKAHSAVNMRTGLVNADYDGTMTLVNLRAALVNHIDNYFDITDEPVAQKDTSEQDFKLVVTVVPNPVWNEVLLTGLTAFKGAELKADFSNRKQALNATVTVPLIQYSGTRATEVIAEVHSDAERINYSLNLGSLARGNAKVQRTSLAGSVLQNRMAFALTVFHKDSGTRLSVSGDIKQQPLRHYTVHIDPDPTIDNDKWVLKEDNAIAFGKNGVYVNALHMTNNGQVFDAQSEGADESAPVKITFKDFEIGSLSRVFERDTAILRGVVNGSVELRNLAKTPAFVSDMQVTNVAYLQYPIGNLRVRADNLTTDKYVAHVTLAGEENNVDVEGMYYNEKEGKLEVMMDIKRLSMKTMEPFSQKYIRRGTGYLTGKVRIKGTLDQPVTNGEIHFRQAGFNIAYINNTISIPAEQVTIDPEGIQFRNFSIIDSTGHPAVVDGTIHTTDFRHMRFDLTVKTTEFTVLNTTLRDNPLYFGQVALSSNIHITGNETLPVVDITGKVLSGTHITVVVPSSHLSIDRGEGVVILIDTSYMGSIMSRRDTIVVGKFKGVQLTADVEINRQASFKVIVDRVSGDSLAVTGDGVLHFAIDPSGTQYLDGTYTLYHGTYSATFQRVMKREFTLKPGSTITWNGSPTDATLDITAVYHTRSSPAELFSTELTGAGTSERNAYRKPMPFDVAMMMKGALMRPQLSFMIDVPEKDRSAFGGMVYSKINSVNSDPAELNKQVFGLLVLNKFIPPQNSGEESGLTANTIARSSVSQVLSDQLNMLSGRYIKDVEVNVDIQSNQQYAGSTVAQNTAVQVGLRKEFLNNRLAVQVGSNINVNNPNNNAAVASTNASNLTGDVVVEYRITEDGRYRFKAFRENQYEGIIDGALYKTGIGIIYTRNYDAIKELFSPPKEEEPENTPKP